MGTGLFSQRAIGLWIKPLQCDNIGLCVRDNVAYIYLKRQGLAARP
jgi:hypothetical protein